LTADLQSERLAESKPVAWKLFGAKGRGLRLSCEQRRPVARLPQIIQAQRLFGDPDYLLRVVTTDLPAYQQLYDAKLANLPGVQRLTSTIVMKQIVEQRELTAAAASGAYA
jgi:DNA-binding Lrp family transcriptional regulator